MGAYRRDFEHFVNVLESFRDFQSFLERFEGFGRVSGEFQTVSQHFGGCWRVWDWEWLGTIWES